MRFEKPPEEAVENIEQAQFAAYIENSFQAQAEAYASYLNNPEAYLGEERKYFEKLNIPPDYLIKEGEVCAEKGGEFYVWAKEAKKIQESGSKWEALKLIAKSGFEFAGSVFKEVKTLFTPSLGEDIDKQLKWMKGEHEPTREEWNRWSDQHGEDLEFAGNFGKFAMSIGILFGHYGEMLPYSDLERIKEETKRYYVYKDGRENQPAETHNAGEKETEGAKEEKDERERNEDDSREREKETKGWGEVADKLTDVIFATEANFYDEYLKNPESFPESVRKHFEELKKDGVTTKEIRKEGEYWKKTVQETLAWDKRLDDLSDEKLAQEEGANLFRFLESLFVGEDKKKKDLRKERAISFFKFFRTAYKRHK